jgi:hypothetical protein
MSVSTRTVGRLAAGVVTLAIAAVTAGPASAADRNHDRIPDRWEVKNDLSLSQNQARKDQDRDGLRNRGEFEGNMDPHDADTDGDGVDDGVEGAGTVASFDSTSGELVINLFSGDSVSGTVTADTEIDCNNDDEVQPDDHGDDPSGHDGNDDQGDDGPGHDGTDDNGDDGPGHDRSVTTSSSGNDEGSDDDNCSTADLVSGTVVREAELDLTASGLVFDEIELR